MIEKVKGRRCLLCLMPVEGVGTPYMVDDENICWVICNNHPASFTEMMDGLVKDLYLHGEKLPKKDLQSHFWYMSGLIHGVERGFYEHYRQIIREVGYCCDIHYESTPAPHMHICMEKIDHKSRHICRTCNLEWGESKEPPSKYRYAPCEFRYAGNFCNHPDKDVKAGTLCKNICDAKICPRELAEIPEKTPKCDVTNCQKEMYSTFNNHKLCEEHFNEALKGLVE